MSWEGIPDPIDPWMTHPAVMVLTVHRPTGSCNHEYTVMSPAGAIARTCYFWVHGIYPLLGRDACYPVLPNTVGWVYTTGGVPVIY